MSRNEAVITDLVREVVVTLTLMMANQKGKSTCITSF